MSNPIFTRATPYDADVDMSMVPNEVIASSNVEGDVVLVDRFGTEITFPVAAGSTHFPFAPASVSPGGTADVVALGSSGDGTGSLTYILSYFGSRLVAHYDAPTPGGTQDVFSQETPLYGTYANTITPSTDPDITDTGVWTRDGLASVTEEAGAGPNGENAYLLTLNTDNSAHRVSSRSPVLTAAAFPHSEIRVYVKAGSGAGNVIVGTYGGFPLVNVNTITGTINSSNTQPGQRAPTIAAAGNGWHLVTVYGQSQLGPAQVLLASGTGVAAPNYSFAGNGTDSVRVVFDGVQRLGVSALIDRRGGASAVQTTPDNRPEIISAGGLRIAGHGSQFLSAAHTGIRAALASTSWTIMVAHDSTQTNQRALCGITQSNTSVQLLRDSGGGIRVWRQHLCPGWRRISRCSGCSWWRVHAR